MHSGLQLYDWIRAMNSSRTKIHTCAHGLVASAALVAYLAGSTRYALRNSLFLVHDVKTRAAGEWVRCAEAADDARHARLLSRKVAAILRRRTLLTPQRVRRMMARDCAFGARKAIARGVAHFYYSGSSVVQ